MEIAIIPPPACIELIIDRPVQMLIPKAVNDGMVAAYYRAAGWGRTQFVMMDNGMFEKPIMPNWKVIDMGRLYNAQEIVLPDVWGDVAGTLADTKDFLTELKRTAIAPWSPRLQVVVHGKNMKQAKDFVQEVAEDLPSVVTLGISRSLSRACLNLYARVELAEWIQTKFPDRFFIHLLGLDDNWHGELKAANRCLCRSLDTAAPFYGEDLTVRPSPTPRRPRDYFSLTNPDSFDFKLAKKNIDYLDGLAHE